MEDTKPSKKRQRRLRRRNKILAEIETQKETKRNRRYRRIDGPHAKAWDAIEASKFGTVCEVTHKTPWGFIKDDKMIVNLDVDTYLEEGGYFDTVILHILLGHGINMELLEELLEKAYKNSLKIIVLEHNPEAHEWSANYNVSEERLQTVTNFIISKKEKYNVRRWGRNMLYEFTTIAPMFLPQINDIYFKKYGYFKFYKLSPPATCPVNKIYMMTSEEKIEDEIIDVLPNVPMNWVIGGGMIMKNIEDIPYHEHRCFDFSLLQTVYFRYLFEKKRSVEFLRKINSLYPITEMERMRLTTPSSFRHWQNVYKLSGERVWDLVRDRVTAIEHKDISKIVAVNEIFYVSTVNPKYFDKLKSKNTIIYAGAPHNDMPEIGWS